LRLVHIYADIAARTETIHSSAATALKSRSNTANTVEGAAMPKLHDLGVAEAAKAIRTGETTAEALADALLRARRSGQASIPSSRSSRTKSAPRPGKPTGSGQQARQSARCTACRLR
jgi:hypothetical protein